LEERLEKFIKVFIEDFLEEFLDNYLVVSREKLQAKSLKKFQRIFGGFFCSSGGNS